jgi:hypothetical protein
MLFASFGAVLIFVAAELKRSTRSSPAQGAYELSRARGFRA